MNRILLISNSTLFGRGYLDHAEEEIRDLLRGESSVLFIPILQFHEECATPVAGLREGAMLRVEGASVVLKGTAGARLFRKGQPPAEAVPVADVGALLAP